MKKGIILILLFAANISLRAQDQSYFMLPYTPELTAEDLLSLSHVNYVHQNTRTNFINTPQGTFVLPPNIRVYPSNIRQTETAIVRHPLNQNIMFASANTQGSILSEGVYVTTDGGVTWFGSDTLRGLPINSHGGDPGIAIDKDGLFYMVHIGGGTVQGMAANLSTDYGLTWSNSVQIQPGNLLMHEASTGTVDAPASPYYGRSFTTYTDVTSIRKVQFSFPSDAGWSAPVTVSPVSSTGHYQAWSDCPSRSGPNGEIYIIWNNYINSSSIPDSIGFVKSTDGGANWVNATNTAFDIDGLPTGSTINGMRYFSFPRVDVDCSGGPRNGWIYIVTNERTTPPATDLADVILHRSTDGGVTWSAGIRVNQDLPGNGKYQVFPAIRVDESGAVNIVYYDSRNIPTNDSVEVFVSHSTDGGTTWTEIIASDHKSRPKAGYQGDYIGITSGNGKVWPCWMDDFSGVQQAWTVGISVITGIAENNNTPKNFSLKQNYPNPFNPVTKIKFDVPLETHSNASLRIYDIRGKEIATLVDSELKPGSYEVEWNASSAPSGVYFYKLSAGNYTNTKKMILVK